MQISIFICYNVLNGCSGFSTLASEAWDGAPQRWLGHNSLKFHHVSYSHLVLTPSVDSAILSGEPPDFLKNLTVWTENKSTNWKLCWRATKHGWAASTFHGNCDNKKPTVTIIKVGNYIFGGYATESWEGETYNSFSYLIFNFFEQEKCQSRCL
jgi:hypothetical protein